MAFLLVYSPFPFTAFCVALQMFSSSHPAYTKIVMPLPKLKVAVLTGGLSRERERRLISGEATAQALINAGHSVILLDTALGFDCIRGSLLTADVAFPRDEDGVVQDYLEDMGVPYVGSGPSASIICYYKDRYKSLLINNNITVPNGEVLTAYHEFESSSFSQNPFVLKPVDGGSSIDTFVILQRSKAEDEEIKRVFDRNKNMIIEEYIDGQEITVCILEDEALPIIEIIPPKGEWFDTHNKYSGKTKEICPPVGISESVQEAAQSLALKIHSLADCRDLSRTDMIVREDETIVTLETNTMPGASEEGLFAKAVAAQGMDLSMVFDTLVWRAFHRK